MTCVHAVPVGVEPAGEVVAVVVGDVRIPLRHQWPQLLDQLGRGFGCSRFVDRSVRGRRGLDSGRAFRAGCSRSCRDRARGRGVIGRCLGRSVVGRRRDRSVVGRCWGFCVVGWCGGRDVVGCRREQSVAGRGVFGVDTGRRWRAVLGGGVLLDHAPGVGRAVGRWDGSGCRSGGRSGGLRSRGVTCRGVTCRRLLAGEQGAGDPDRHCRHDEQQQDPYSRPARHEPAQSRWSHRRRR